MTLRPVFYRGLQAPEAAAALTPCSFHTHPVYIYLSLGGHVKDFLTLLQVNGKTKLTGSCLQRSVHSITSFSFIATKRIELFSKQYEHYNMDIKY